MIKLNELVTHVKSELDDVWSGILFGETVAIDFVDMLVKVHPELSKDCFGIIKLAFGDVLDTENLKDYLEKLEQIYYDQDLTIVGYYGFGGNDEGIAVIENVLLLIEEKGL